MNETSHAALRGAKPDFVVTGDLARRLQLALNMALAESVFSGDQKRLNNALMGLIDAFCAETYRDLAEKKRDEVEDFTALLAPAIQNPAGKLVPNRIWTHPGFILPTIAALAQFFDRCLDPFGDSVMTLTVEAAPGTLTGYLLRDLSVMDMARDGLLGRAQQRPINRAERLRINTLLASASLLLLANPESGRFNTIAANYLTSEAARTGTGRAPERDAQTGEYRLDGASPFIRVIPQGFLKAE